MQVWLESRHLATLLLWLEKSGVNVRFRSEIVRVALEQLVYHLIESGEIEMVELAEDAQNMLERRFGVDNNPSGRGIRNKIHNLQIDAKRSENRTPDTATGITGAKDEFTMSPAQLAEFERIYKEERSKVTKAQADEQLARAKKNMKFDENGVVQLLN